MADRTFEQALRELEGRVVQLEKGELPLDEALRLFEEGVGLLRECHDRLDAAEARIVALSSQGDSVTESPQSRS